MGRIARFLAGALALILVALVVAGVVITVSDRAASVKVKEWAGNSVEDVTQELKDYLKQNTQ